jgi:sugar O-acyltransferase (sialic acid O-acetyltransferase NeuD family)
MANKNIHIISIGGASKIALDILSHQPNFDSLNIKLYDDKVSLKNTKYLSHDIIGNTNLLLSTIQKGDFFFNGISNINYLKNKNSLNIELEKLGALPLSVIHPTAFISKESTIDVGAFICPQSTINTGVKIGKYVVMFSQVVIEHESIIGDNCYFSPGAIVCGKCKIGNNVYIGPNATIGANVTVGNNAIIGAGSVVLHDIMENELVIGAPAKFLKPNPYW